MSEVTQEQLADLRLRALFRDHPAAAHAWAESQVGAHRLLMVLEQLGWSRGDRLMALQEMHRSTWIQVAERDPEP